MADEREPAFTSHHLFPRSTATLTSEDSPDDSLDWGFYAPSIDQREPD